MTVRHIIWDHKAPHLARQAAVDAALQGRA